MDSGLDSDQNLAWILLGMEILVHSCVMWLIHMWYDSWTRGMTRASSTHSALRHAVRTQRYIYICIYAHMHICICIFGIAHACTSHTTSSWVISHMNESHHTWMEVRIPNEPLHGFENTAIYIYMYICTYAYMYMYFGCTIYMCIYIHTYIYIYIYIRRYTCIYTYMHTCREETKCRIYQIIYIYVFWMNDIYIYIYIYTYMHVYINVYVYMYMLK